MRLKDTKFLLNLLNDKMVDFYLEDDMFEIEGKAKAVKGEIIIEVLYAVEHIMEMSGEFLKIQDRNRKLFAQRIDTGKIFEMEINRVYDKLKDPIVEDFLEMKKLGVEQFFKKDTDTLVWFDDETEKWVIELNKINMYFCGERTSYSTLEQLFDSNKEYIDGIWQAVYFSSEAELVQIDISR
ncbi:hypothetical protein J2Z76_003324 [Sedimentibacter acidaminivorans]|uniref:DUF2262 domain-containing protein n=1 Tax=Sedimentibacter acidaminivorans TaxID=913099 RepID=A0ABS4GIJ7_9FIRM|nr:hypothetical protein [Sedimentibacter acidaminivorans]MBP1927422.1 hypothetical protein [Sedimentibacter acidaminivorans]